MDAASSLFDFALDCLLLDNLRLPILAFFIGAIPFGYLLAKRQGIDVLSAGSKSTGATNVLRLLKAKDPKLAKKIAALTLFLDFIKGLLALFLAHFVFELSEASLWLCALMAVLGHCFSPFLSMKGGKGVASSAGVLLFFYPYCIALGFLAWFLVGKILKTSSLASFAGLFAVGISMFYLYPDPLIKTHTPAVLILLIVLIRHSENIKRLIFRTEKAVL